MLAVCLALAASIATGYGTILTKDLVTTLPTWQTLGPLFLLNALCCLPLAVICDWQIRRPEVLGLHAASIGVIAVTAVVGFALIDRGSASAVAVAEGVSPAAVLLLGPLLLGEGPTALAIAGTVVLIAGAVLPIRGAFSGLVRYHAIALMLLAGITTGLLTVLTGALVSRSVGVGEIYVVRTAGAAALFWVARPPREIEIRAWPKLGGRSSMVTAGFVLTILALQRGSVLLVQSVLAITPLMVTVMESTAARRRPTRETAMAAAACCTGMVALLVATHQTGN